MPEIFRPIFVVGCQRSGSTLLGSMLGAHPEIVCIPEGQFIVDLMPTADPQAKVDPSQIIGRIDTHWRFRVWEFDLGSDRPVAGEVEPTYRGAIEWLVRHYADANNRPGAKVWVDHQPGHVRFLWRLLQHFPDAKVIHIIRDGRAVAASIMPLDWGPNVILSAAMFWKLNVGLGFAASANLGPDQLMHVHYEDLVQDSEATMRRIAEFAGISFDQAMVTTSGLRVPRFTEDQHHLIGTPPTPDRINAWQKKLSRRQIRIFEKKTNDLLRQLGYQTLAELDPPNVSWMEALLLFLEDQIKKLINGIRFWYRRRRYSP